MTDQVVQPNLGNAAPPMPGTDTVPTQRRGFRRAQQHGLDSVPAPATLYNKETAAPPLIGQVNEVNHSAQRDDTANEFVACDIALMAVWRLLCGRLASHDRFLKDTTSWHPYMDLLYLKFCLNYFILLARQNRGQLQGDDLTVLDVLKKKYPADQLHIPGIYIQFFMACTVTDSPYYWEGLIVPALPRVNNTTPIANDGCTPSRGYILSHGNHVALNPLLILNMVYQVLSTRRTSSEQAVVAPSIIGNEVRMFGRIVQNNDALRFAINNPLFRTGNPSTTRSEDAFWFNNILDPSRTAPGVSTPQFGLDLPLMPMHGANTDHVNMYQYLGIQDAPVVAQGAVRTDRYRNWPMYYSHVMNLQCQYVQGSRSLSDIPISGIGANTVVWRYADNILNFSDPSQGNNNFAIPLAMWQNHMRLRTLQQLEVTGANRDPELELVALQISIIAQVNVSLNGQAHGARDNTLRAGPFWAHPVVSAIPTFDIVGPLASGVPAFISSVVRR